MAELALERNYKYALNLDGGGSTNIQYHYGSLLKTADRRGLPGVVYERMVPVLGVLKNKND
jgi:exopolysaccharide biosynthesis protein